MNSRDSDGLQAARAQLVSYSARLLDDGLAVGSAGNISVRLGDLVAITPSGVSYAEMRPEDVCLVTPEGELADGPKPSVELPMHLAVLAARTDVGAVVHTHSPRATANPPAPLAVGRSGTPELGTAVVAAAGDGYEVVIENHGPVCFGADLADALRRALELEARASASG